jgi:ubiquitin carboxyl-terminal hydrolase 8
MVLPNDPRDHDSPVQQLRTSAETSLVRSGRINDLINNALGYLEHCRQDLPKGLAEASYINYWHAYLLLFEVIPNHSEYESFSTKKSSAFFQSYLELRNIVENEGYVEELESYLNSKSSRSFEYSGTKKTNGGTGTAKVHNVKRKAVGSPASTPANMSSTSLATTLSIDENFQIAQNGESGKNVKNIDSQTAPNVQNGHEDPLASRFRKLRFNSQVDQTTRDTARNSVSYQQQIYSHTDPMIPRAIPSPSKPPTDPPAPAIAPPPPPSHEYQNAGQQKSLAPGPRINPSIIFPKTTVLNSETLAKYLQYVPESILLLDVRDRISFDQGHINAPNVVCIEPISLRQNMNDEGLEDTLVLAPEKEQEIFATRSRFELVVMYDSDSRSNAYRGGPSSDSQAKTLFHLTTAIYDYAFSKPLKRPPCLLVGGFESWLDDFGGKHVSRSNTAPQQAQIQTPTVPQEIPSRPYGSRKGSTASIPGVGANGYARDLNDFFRSPPPTQSPIAYSQQQQQQTNGYFPDGFISAPSTPPRGTRSSHSKSLSIASPRPVYSPPSQDKHISMPVPFTAATLPVNSAVPPAISVPPPSHSAPPINPLKITSQEFTTGLKNLGNTCYMNSILQCLAGTPVLAASFVDGSYRNFVNVNSRLGYKGVLAQKFAELVQTMYRESVAYVGPVSLKQLSGQLRDTFQGYEQQDCQEFLTFILDGLHEDLNSNGDKERLKELTESEERRREGMSVRVASTIEWERYLKSDYSLIVDTCQGQYQSRLRCLTCNFTSTIYSVFSFLSLPIPLKRDVVTLHDCFDLFTAEEILDGDDAWHCPHCKQPRRSSKRLQISRLPNILILHLKRFRQRGWTRTSDKLETFVTYPVNNLDLTEYWPNYSGDDEQRLSRIPVRGQTAPFRYDLYGIANHYGSLKGGHYTSFVRKGRKGWCYFDDIRISRNVPMETLVNPNAYVLFYERKNKLQ